MTDRRKPENLTPPVVNHRRMKPSCPRSSSDRRRVRRRRVLAASLVGVAVCVLAGCGGGSATTNVKTASTTASAAGPPGGFTKIPTVKCRTTEGVHQPAARLEPTTAVAAPSSLAEKLAAYLDAVGTMVIAPVGFECAAAIGVDGSENVTAYPKGGVNPEENPSEPRSGTVVSVNIATACQGCIAEAVCTLFPEARPVKDYYVTIGGAKCPEKPLREEVSYPAPSTALFADPPRSRRRAWVPVAPIRRSARPAIPNR
jgi:hypothetical protein